MLAAPYRVAVFRAAAVLVAAGWAVMAFRFPLRNVSIETGMVLAMLAALTGALPIATTRAKRLTFTTPVLFAAALMLGSWAAGGIALAACLLEGRAWERRRFWTAFARGAAYLGAASAVTMLSAVHAISLPVRAAAFSELPPIFLAAVCYISAFAAAMFGLASLRRTKRLRTIQGVLAAEALAFLLSLPFVALIAVLPRADFAVGAVVFALGVTAAAAAIRAQVELSALRRQVHAMEVLIQQAIDAPDVDSVLRHTITAAREMLLFDQAFIWAGDADGNSFELRARWAEDNEPPLPEMTTFGSGLIGRIAERRRGMIRASAIDPRWEDMLRGSSLCLADFPSLLVVPLVTAQRTVGVALLMDREGGRYQPRDLERMQTVANLVASTLDNVRMHQRLRAIAVTDGLTGLTNHRRLQEILSEEIWRAQRYHRPLSVIMCDVDSFKSYNDTYGHPLGDELLRRMARVLSDSVRAVDTVARYGGEEFFILLPETDLLPAEQMAERLRRAIAVARFPGASETETLQKTMSFGVASFPECMEGAEQLIPLADAALYRAKHSGKNQVQSARRGNMYPAGHSARLPGTRP